MNPHPIISVIIFVLLALIAFTSVKANKLTTTGGITGFVIACIIYTGAGVTGVELLALFFGLGIAASRWKRNEKYTGTYQDTAEARRPGQVLANAGVAGLLAISALVFPIHAVLFKLMLAGSLASATADTLSSELGVVYSRHFYNCLSFKPDTKGLDGVISIEGLLFGAAGALLLAAVTAINFNALYILFIIIIAGVIGNYSDSVLGATLERRKLLNNDAVNFLSTLIAAISIRLMLLI